MREKRICRAKIFFTMERKWRLLTVQRRRNKIKSSSVLRWVTPMNNGLVARLDLNIPEERVRKSRMKSTARRRDGGSCFEEKGIGFMVKIVEDRSKLRLRIFQWNPMAISDSGLE